MNGKQLITYNDIVNIVLNYIKSNCKNYLNLNNMPAYYKNAYSVATNQAFGANVTLQLKRTLTNSISAVSEATINNDMHSFLYDVLQIGEYLDYNVNNKNYFNFLCNMAVFCYTKLGVITSNDFAVGDVKADGTVSKSNVNTVLVYLPSNNTYNNLIPLDKTLIAMEADTLYSVNEINIQFQSLINSLKNNNVKTVSNKYNFTITAV